MKGIAAQPLVPAAIVIFGGTGDLAKTKLLPALFDLYQQSLLPSEFTIIALSRKEYADEAYRDYAKACIREKTNATEATLEAFVASIRYVAGNFSDPHAYEAINAALAAYDASLGRCSNKLFYLAVPPNLYADIFAKLKESNVMAPCDGGWSRLLVEKPFGSDLETAQALEAQLCELFTEEQIYRIDHYLAKDAIENIISLRFANSILADSWQGSRIESIDIRLYESADVANRGAFYDGIGALRDVGQNHLLQLLALLTMASVDVHDPHAMRQARAEAIARLTSARIDALVRGQYDGYRATVGVSPSSMTETYFKITATLTTEPWENVVVHLESGKALLSSYTEAIITFAAADLCRCASVATPHQHQNVLKVRFSPEQSIHLTMWVKEPGFGFRLHERELILAEQVGEKFRSPEAYERVLYDCIVGDQTRFVSGPEVQAEWNFITPILAAFKESPLEVYQKGAAPPIVNS